VQGPSQNFWAVENITCASKRLSPLVFQVDFAIGYRTASELESRRLHTLTAWAVTCLGTDALNLVKVKRAVIYEMICGTSYFVSGYSLRRRRFESELGALVQYIERMF